MLGGVMLSFSFFDLGRSNNTACLLLEVKNESGPRAMKDFSELKDGWMHLAHISHVKVIIELPTILTLGQIKTPNSHTNARTVVFI